MVDASDGTSTRRRFMAGAVVAATGISQMFGEALPADAPRRGFEDLPGLRQNASRSGRSFGAAVQAGHLDREPDFAAAVGRECNAIVPERDMSWGVMRGQPGAFNFAGADRLAEFARRHGMTVRGAHLLWYYDVPSWVETVLKAGGGEALLEEHIFALAARYGDVVTSWNVVNEAIKPADGLEGGLRQSPWLRALGASYIETAFRVAARAAPKAQLVYNDYGMDFDQAKADAVLDLLRRLRRRHVPIHAVGIQGHLAERQHFTPLVGFCREARRLGLEVVVSELDVRELAVPVAAAARDRLVAETTRIFLDQVASVAPPRTLVTWGLSDRHSWLGLDLERPRPFGRHVRGLPLDEDCRRKPMWHELYRHMTASVD